MRSVIYSADPQFVAAFHNASGEFKLQQQHVTTAGELMQLCTSQTLDLVVIDLDPAMHGADMLPLVKKESANRDVVIFAGRNNETAESVLALGASVAMAKPISVDLARRHLRDALLITDGERRNYNRVSASGAMHMQSESDGRIDGELINIGEGGLALKLTRTPRERANVEVVFTLPGEPGEIHAPGKISWADPVGNVGIRFIALDPPFRYRLSDWIANAEKAATP